MLPAALRVIYPAEVTLSLKLVLKVIFPTQKLKKHFLPACCVWSPLFWWVPGKGYRNMKRQVPCLQEVDSVFSE